MNGACRGEFGPFLDQSVGVRLMGHSIRLELTPLGFESRLSGLQLAKGAGVLGVEANSNSDRLAFDAACGFRKLCTRRGGLLLVATEFVAGPIDFRALRIEHPAFLMGGSLKLLVVFRKLFSVVVQGNPFGLEKISLRRKRLGLRGKSVLLSLEGFSIRLLPGAFGFDLLLGKCHRRATLIQLAAPMFKLETLVGKG